MSLALAAGSVACHGPAAIVARHPRALADGPGTPVEFGEGDGVHRTGSPRSIPLGDGRVLYLQVYASYSGAYNDTRWCGIALGRPPGPGGAALRFEGESACAHRAFAYDDGVIELRGGRSGRAIAQEAWIEPSVWQSAPRDQTIWLRIASGHVEHLRGRVQPAP